MMKKYMLICALFLVGTACSDKEEAQPQPEFDPPHYEVHFRVLNEETGDNLLYANTPYLPKSGAWVVCGEQEYALSRYDQPYYDPKAPFRFERYTRDGGYHHRVVFDGFTLDQSFRQPLQIYWGEVMDFYTEIVVGAEVDPSGPEPVITQTLEVNGKPVSCEQGQDWQVVLSFKEEWISIPDACAPKSRKSSDCNPR